MTDIVTLWRFRRNRSAQETLRYFRDAARGGLTAFLLLAFIIGSYAYGRMLQKLSTDFPFWWIAIALLIPVTVYGSVRTFLREPDTAFLLAAETRMRPYFSRSFAYSLTVQGFGILCVAVVLWPLYGHCREDLAEPFWLHASLLLALKSSQLAATWQESRFTNPNGRFVIHLFRFIMCFLILYAEFAHSVKSAFVLFVPALLVYAAACRLLPKHRVAWENLILTEKQMLARRNRVFSWFGDVPELHGEVRRRRLWSAIAYRISFRQDRTMLLMMTLTFLRSELFSIALRITAIGILLMSILPAGLMTYFICGLCLLMTAIQLSGIEHMHKFSVWPRLYPIPDEQRISAERRIRRTVLYLQSAVMGCTVGVVTRSLTEAVIALLASGLLSLAFTSFRKKKPKHRALS